MTIIKHKNSGVAGKVPAVVDLAVGEIAINTTDGKIFTKKVVGGIESVVDLTGGVATGSGLRVQTITNTGVGAVGKDAMVVGVSKTANQVVTLPVIDNYKAGDTLLLGVSYDSVANGSNNQILFQDANGRYAAVLSQIAPIGAVKSVGGKWVVESSVFAPLYTLGVPLVGLSSYTYPTMTAYKSRVAAQAYTTTDNTGVLVGNTMSGRSVLNSSTHALQSSPSVKVTQYSTSNAKLVYLNENLLIGLSCNNSGNQYPTAWTYSINADGIPTHLATMSWDSFPSGYMSNNVNYGAARMTNTSALFAYLQTGFDNVNLVRVCLVSTNADGTIITPSARVPVPAGGISSNMVSMKIVRLTNTLAVLVGCGSVGGGEEKTLYALPIIVSGTTVTAAANWITIGTTYSNGLQSVMGNFDVVRNSDTSALIVFTSFADYGYMNVTGLYITDPATGAASRGNVTRVSTTYIANVYNGIAAANGHVAAAAFISDGSTYVFMGSIGRQITLAPSLPGAVTLSPVGEFTLKYPVKVVQYSRMFDYCLDSTAVQKIVYMIDTANYSIYAQEVM